MTIAEVHASGGPQWPVVRLIGAVDLSNVEEVGLRLERSVSNRALGLVLDLSGVTYLDSTGVRLVYRLVRQLADRQQRLRLVVPDGALISRVLTLSGVATVADVVRDLADLPGEEGEELP